MTQRLIENWLPIAALGEESVRERRSMTALPPVYYLHVWWARRPLVAARAAVLASLLPADADREKFMHVLGIHGDPVASRRRIDEARRKGQRFEGEAYSYPRAFSYCPSETEHAWFREEAARCGTPHPVVLDPTAGGGAIPFEAIRLGVTTFANDLNPVAAFIMRATVEWPAAFGFGVLAEFKRLAAEFVSRREESLKPFFPPEPESNGIPTNYLWARTITCPYCDGLIPLSPSWRLAPDGTGVRLHPDTTTKRCGFEIVPRASRQSEGTVTGGDAKCPYPGCGRIIDGDEVKQQAEAGGMGEQLFTIVFKRKILTTTKAGRTRFKWEYGYRAPRPEDDNSEFIRQQLAEKLAEWKANGIVPIERLPMDTESWTHGNTPAQFGAVHFLDLFTPRQRLVHGTAVEVFGDLLRRNSTSPLGSTSSAALGFLAIAIDKSIDYNSRTSAWHAGREVMEHTFRDHAFPLKWSFAEMSPLDDGSGNDWVVRQTSKCIKELIELTRPDLAAARAQPPTAPLFDAPPDESQERSTQRPCITITCQSADSLTQLDDGSVDCVVMDPPYYDNLMYAELSDFFYVWLKRTAGRVYPELFRRQLTDKENEAVANPAKFQRQKGAKALAARDYRQRMAGIFTECRRVLKPQGIMTLMFTHKATGAWDALASGLMEAGFTVTASWPVHTEAEESLHIKNKSAAKSTIFLVCRPRVSRSPGADTVYWEDVEPRVAKVVRERVEMHQKAGIGGVDLYLSCFGPALEEFARHWPLRRGTPRVIPVRKRKAQESLFGDGLDPYAVTPEDALDAARREVKQWRLQRLLHAKRQDDLDPLTEWFVLAWDSFKAPKFPYDEALRLARVVGLDLDADVVGKVAEKKGSDLLLWDSAKRAARGALGAADGSRSAMDAVHHVAWRIRQQNVQAGREVVERARLDASPGFITALTAVLEVLPVSSTFTNVKSEAGAVAEAASDFDALEHLRRLMFSDRIPEPEQLKFWAD
jgi:adenine-specific DNA methylase